MKLLALCRGPPHFLLNTARYACLTSAYNNHTSGITPDLIMARIITAPQAASEAMHSSLVQNRCIRRQRYNGNGRHTDRELERQTTYSDSLPDLSSKWMSMHRILDVTLNVKKRIRTATIMVRTRKDGPKKLVKQVMIWKLFFHRMTQTSPSNLTLKMSAPSMYMGRIRLSPIAHGRKIRIPENIPFPDPSSNFGDTMW